MAQLAQRFCFNLPYAFARDRERLPDFLERVLAAIVQTKPHFDDFFLARRQRLQHRRSLFLQIEVNHRIRRRNYSLVFDEVAQVGVLFLANRRLKGNRLVRTSLLIVSIMCTGMRMVRAWSAIARVIAWRIHQVAYVENLYPRRHSNLSTAFINPMLPS